MRTCAPVGEGRKTTVLEAGHRRVALAAAAVACVVLLAASGAYACTKFYGLAQVTIATGSPSGSGSASVRGDQAGMGWCSGGSSTLQVADATPPGAAPTILRWVQSATTACGVDPTNPANPKTNKLPVIGDWATSTLNDFSITLLDARGVGTGDYLVSYSPGWDYDGLHHACHAQNLSNETLLGGMTILPDGSNGPAGSTYTMPAAVVPGNGTVCVWHPAFVEAIGVQVQGV